MSNNHNTNQFGHLNGGYIGCGIINYQDEIANPIGLESLPTQSRNGFIPLERYYHNKSSKNEGATSAEYLKSPTIAGNNAAVDALDGLSRYNYIASGYENTSVANNFTTQLPCTDLQHVMSNINLINTMDSYNSLFRQQISNPDMFLSSVINDQASIHKTSSHRELPEAIFDINSLISSGNDSCNDFISSLSTSSTTSAIPILQNTISSPGPNTTDIGTNVHDNSDQARLSDLISTIIPTRKRKKVAAAYTNMEASKGISASVYADPDVTKPSTKRMKSWRQKNPQKNKNNDLRCRITRDMCIKSYLSEGRTKKLGIY
ncbi:hypothetical protein AX774_g2472 [Zancudomyces culisetae]|uniref:DUF3020 domain-containing protein n=1 Tax=Zancudomyces culisetae TaxID=1213189 RepID=A0A1R1PSR2_ZANCU|nr:hypothetical protein AX774_g2472 [Zancudomyces culisetae]|eukprot:OMH84010.1 hypothetical protein AX774_g2472 [Zancudomyces culisetae]